MSSYRKHSNQPSSDKTQNQYLIKLKGLFAKTVGDFKDHSTNQKQKYSSIKDKKQLKQPKEFQQKNAQGVLMQQLNNFHDHYGGKINELKVEIQNLKQTVKILEYEVAQRERKLNEKETQLEIASRENDELLRIIENDRQEKQKKNDKSDIHTFYQSLNESYKEKLFILQRKHSEEIEMMKMKVMQVVKQKEEVVKSIQKLTHENSEMKLEIKQYEIEKKYQNQRIKNATLQLNIKLKNQDELINKMKREQQSKELYVRNNTCRLSDIEKRDTMNDSAGGGILTSDPNCQSVLSGSILNEFKVTNKKIHNLGEWNRNSKQLPVFMTEKQRMKERQKQRLREKQKDKENGKEKEKKSRCKQTHHGQNSHKRNLSYHQNIAHECSPREQEEEKLKTTREAGGKGNSELKIKVMRLEKMRRKEK